MLIKLFSFLTVICVALSSFFTGTFNIRGEDIKIIYTNDVHSGIEENMGYAGLAAYKKEVESTNKNVTLVDCGDFVQGNRVSSLSSGEYNVDIMNAVGYDFAVLGNHEFDYGMEQLGRLIEKSDYEYLGCNLTYSGSGENELSDVEDFEIVDYRKTQVAFIGVSTPYSIIQSVPANFKDENENFIYGFEEDIAGFVQKNVLKARLRGADYVVVLAHLGDTEIFSPWNSVELIEETVGIDAVLDGHAHSVINTTVKNKKGEDVILSSTGTRFQNIGTLTITSDGEVSSSLLSSYEGRDADIQKFIDDINQKCDEVAGTVIGKAEYDLPMTDSDGVRMTRNRETALADFAADAYLSVSSAEISFVNGGGLRSPLPKGDVTYGTMIDVNSFGNKLCVIEATGSQIADALEWTSRYTKADYKEDGRAVGENGGFLIPSGLKYTIDTSVPSPVITEDKSFAGIEEGKERRVKDIMVLQDGEYVPIDLNKTYKVTGSKYVLMENGDGMTAFNGCNVVLAEGMIDNEALISYVKNDLGGVIGEKYSEPAGRVTVE